MKILHLVKSTVAFSHLSLVVCGAAGLFACLASETLQDQTLQLYGALSGANNGYGFFAPGVSSQVRATFSLKDADGNTWTDTLERGHSHEAVLRIGGAVSVANYEQVRDQLVRSWAATMFGRHPSAKEITVRLEMYDLPTMEEYRTGARPEWLVIHEAVFARD